LQSTDTPKPAWVLTPGNAWLKKRTSIVSAGVDTKTSDAVLANPRVPHCSSLCME
jgi:hypothetical protein